MKEKILVIGCPGSGKSTFSRRLRDMMGLPLYYLDQIYHNEDKSTISKEEFDQKLSEILTKDQWIIDGNYLRTLALRLDYCDTVFLFDLKTEDCIEGVSSRIGQKREDMPWIEECFDKEFRQYILDFSDHQLPEIYKLLKEQENKKEIIIFHHRKEADSYTQNKSYQKNL